MLKLSPPVSLSSLLSSSFFQRGQRPEWDLVQIGLAQGRLFSELGLPPWLRHGRPGSRPCFSRPWGTLGTQRQHALSLSLGLPRGEGDAFRSPPSPRL